MTSLLLSLSFKTFILFLPSGISLHPDPSLWLSRPSSSGCVDANTQVSALVSVAAIMTALLENYRWTTGELAQEVKVLAV